MTTPDLGSKYVCPDCTTRYYDLNKTPVACPKCGAKPPVAKVPKSSGAAKKAARPAYRRFP
jgi:uncharacterized protein (TIGR02300 family)